MTTKSRSAEIVTCPIQGQTITIPRTSVCCDRVHEATASADALANSNTGTLAVNAGEITYTNGYHRMNYCEHIQDKFTYHGNAPCSICYACRDSKGIAGPSAWPMIPNALTPSAITEQMRRRAWAGLTPQLNTGFSMANFLWELKDLPDLIRLANRLYLGLETLRGAMGLVGRSGGAKTLAELQLAWSYALKPLVTDFQSLYDDLMNTEKRVNEFIDRGRKVMPYHYTEVIGESVSDKVVYPYGYTQDFTSEVYHATMWASYTYTKPSEFEGFRRVMGLRITPEVIWNAIPFSFLIDYVFKVSKFLAALDIDPNLRIEISDYCDSMKSTVVRKDFRSRSGYIFMRYLDDSIYNIDEGFVIWEWERTSYLRVPGMPDPGIAFPVWDELSRREMVLVGALALANLL